MYFSLLYCEQGSGQSLPELQASLKDECILEDNAGAQSSDYRLLQANPVKGTRLRCQVGSEALVVEVRQ